MSLVVKEWNGSETVAITLAGAKPVKGLKRGRAVSVGQKLAENPRPDKGDPHSSIRGLVEEIGELEIIIGRDEQALGEPPEALNLSGLDGLELRAALKNLGLDLPDIPPGDPVIINSLSPEPGLDMAPALFGEHRETMLAGAEAARRLWPERAFYWAAAKEEDIPTDIQGHIIRNKYPEALPALIKKRLTGRNDPLGRGVLGARKLYLIGRVCRTGLPLVRLPLTLGQSNYFVPLGARVIDLLSFANLLPGPADLIIQGGLIRGRSLGRFHRGLGQGDSALHLVKGGGRRESFEPCRGCRRCRRTCPAGLPVDGLASLTPEAWLDEDLSSLTGCLLCGQCALVCPSGRPLMSLTRLAVFRREDFPCRN